MSARWWTLGVGALLAASALFWGLRLFVSVAPVPPSAAVAATGPVARGDLTRLLGSDPAPPVAEAEPPPDARFQLIGVLAPRARSAAAEGLALIAVDGKPAKAYRVGAVVEGQTVLKSVAARGAQLGLRDGTAQVSLMLLPPPAAATGAPPTLPGQPAAPFTQPPPNGGAPVLPPPTVQPMPQQQTTQPMRRTVPLPAMPATLTNR